MELYLFFIFSKDNENMVKLSGGGNKASVETKTHRKVSYDERTLIPEFQEEKFRLNPHVDGFTQQVKLVYRLKIFSEREHLEWLIPRAEIDNLLLLVRPNSKFQQALCWVC